MILRVAGAVTAIALLTGARAPDLDSQLVLRRYALALQSLQAPKVSVYAYTVSQVGASNIEQYHRIYRSGIAVRDETLAIDGIALHRKIVRFSHREDPYNAVRFAPREDAYELLFLGTVKDARHVDYVYEATPLSHPGGAWIDRVTIDGVRFLPRVVHFHSTGLGVRGTGQVEFAAFGRYWMPVAAQALAQVKGKPARERIVWSDYRFPESLPPSTFLQPPPLPQATPTSE